MGQADRAPRVSAAVFDNPDARAFITALAETGDYARVPQMLGKLVGLSDYLDRPEYQTAVAAAAVVAAQLEPGSVELPGALAAALPRFPEPSRELVGMAVTALERVCSEDALARGLPEDAAARLRCELEALLECLLPVVRAPLMHPEGGGQSPAAP